MPSVRLLEPQPDFWPRAIALSLSDYLGGLSSQQSQGSCWQVGTEML